LSRARPSAEPPPNCRTKFTLLYRARGLITQVLEVATRSRYRRGVKPSPVPSILLFAGTLFLAIGLLGRGWTSHDGEGLSVHTGPVWGTVCFEDFRGGDEMKCETTFFLKDLGKGSFGPARLLGLLFILLSLTGMVMSPIAGFILLKKQRSATSLLTLIFAGGGLLIVILLFAYAAIDSPKHFDLPGYGFFLYFLGSVLAVVGAIMGMMRARGAAAGMLPQPYPMPGQGYAPQQPHYPPQQPYPPQAQQPYPPQPQQSPYAPGGQQQPYNPQAAQQGPAHPTCGTPMTWAAQYNRWFCPRCNQYG
jgi:hypothetical protein